MPTGPDTPAVVQASQGPRRRGLLAASMIAGVGAVLLLLFVASGSTVAADGTIVESFGALALGMLALTGAGVVGLSLLFRDVRRNSTCGRDGC